MNIRSFLAISFSYRASDAREEIIVIRAEKEFDEKAVYHRLEETQLLKWRGRWRLDVAFGRDTKRFIERAEYASC